MANGTSRGSGVMTVAGRPSGLVVDVLNQTEPSLQADAMREGSDEFRPVSTSKLRDLPRHREDIPCR
jgi:hypothetical protein